MKKKIYFLNLHIFPLFKVSFISVVICSIFALLWDFPYYNLVLFFIALINVSFFILCIGSISKKLVDDKISLKISTIWKQTKLQGNLKYERWWDYEFATDSQMGDMVENGSSPAGANDLNSYLLITDSKGQQIVLRERIFLDSRFPNEAKYHYNFKVDNYDVYDVQRTDKIKKRIGELQLVNLPKAR